MHLLNKTATQVSSRHADEVMRCVFHIEAKLITQNGSNKSKKKGIDFSYSISTSHHKDVGLRHSQVE